MKLEDQVCSLELSKRLKELGVKQESLFDWCEIDDNDWILMARREKEYKEILETDGEMDGVISAFTVAELGDMLPSEIIVSNGNKFWFETGKSERNHPDYPEHSVAYGNDEECGHVERADNEADARAKMLIYLIENKLVKP